VLGISFSEQFCPGFGLQNELDGWFEPIEAVVLKRLQFAPEVGHSVNLACLHPEPAYFDFRRLPSNTTTLPDAILGSANYAIISTSSEGVVTTFNSTAERWLGYTADEIVGQSTPALWHDAGEMVARAQALSHELGRVIEPGFETFTAKPRLGLADENEWTLIRKDGSRFPATLSATALRDEAGGVTGFLGVLADITERKRAEERLRASEERFRQIVDGVRDYAIFMLDPAGRVASWNSGAQRIKGYTADEIIGRHFSCFYPPDALAGTQPEGKLAEALAVGWVEEEGWRLRKDRTRFFAQVTITAIHYPHGRHRGFSKVTRDITERRRAEARLRESETRVRLAAEVAGVAVWDWDLHSGAIHWDQAMFTIYGLPPTPEGWVRYEDWSGRVLPEDLAAQ